MSDANYRPLTPNVFARLAEAARYVIAGVSPDSWFGPQQPLAPQAPPDVKGRQFDYPFGANLNYIPRSEGGISFQDLRALADALPLLRAVIETRKDQVAAQNYTVRPRARANVPESSARVDKALAFLARPDRRHSFGDWLRMLLEDLLVIDAATIYPRFSRSGALFSLDIVDGATIKPLIGEDGRAPETPDPAYQQILHGVPAADFSADELLYLPRNKRAHKLYGMSPVEQIALTVNIALRRDVATLDYYRAGSSPDAFATLPKEWTADQIRQFRDYFNALMSGNSPRRRMVKFMPADFKLIETRQPRLKDQYDEWLARVICYGFSVSASPFVSQVNRATSETMRLQATQEGLVPLKKRIKSALDQAIQVSMGEPSLEFVWVGDDAIDPLQQALQPSAATRSYPFERKSEPWTPRPARRPTRRPTVPSAYSTRSSPASASRRSASSRTCRWRASNPFCARRSPAAGWRRSPSSPRSRLRASKAWRFPCSTGRKAAISPRSTAR